MADTLNVTVTSSIVTGSTTQNGPPLSFVDSNVSVRLLDKIQIAAGAVDTQITLDGFTARYVILKFNGDVSVKINGTGSTAFALDAAASNPACLILFGAAVTSIHVSNAGATAVDCERLLAG